MTNRVDELESEIAELRAAVNGLTEELVETKARVRELEESAEADRKAAAAAAAAGGTTTKSDDHVEVVEQPEADEQVDPETASEGDNTAESPEQPTDEADDAEPEQSDIIVA